MICKKCGSECPDGNIFCEACGAELEAPVLPDNVDDKGRMKKKVKAVKPKAQPEKPRKEHKEKKKRTPEEKAAFVKKLKAKKNNAIASINSSFNFRLRPIVLAIFETN